MAQSNCTISFFKNDLERARITSGKQCPVKRCSAGLLKAPFQKYKGVMRYLPFCPEHGIRIHEKGFVYYNGPSKGDLLVATQRNLMFQRDYYREHFFQKGAKMESGRLCYESSEDAVSYNVFTELLLAEGSLEELVACIVGIKFKEPVDLYLWGVKIDLKANKALPYKPLLEVRSLLEKKIKRFATEPDIMLVIPKKLVICIEAKLGSKNPVAKEQPEHPGVKPKGRKQLIQCYCEKNTTIRANEIFDFSYEGKVFHEQLFRNLVFAASMAKLEGAPEWHVVNLRNQHVMNLKRGQPESLPMMRAVRSLLRPKFKKRISHLTWEQVFEKVIKGDPRLVDLAWYLKNKSLSCGRAFNII